MGQEAQKNPTKNKNTKHLASPKKLQSCKSQINSLNHPTKQKHLIFSLARINQQEHRLNKYLNWKCKAMHSCIVGRSSAE